MLGHYLSVAFRNLDKSRGYSFINIVGLAVGMALCILILLWVQEELSFDRFHENAGSLYRTVEEIRFTDGTIQHYGLAPSPLAPALQDGFPEIVDTARYRPGTELTVRNGDRSFRQKNIAMADPSFFTMFTFPFLRGDPAQALDDPLSVVLTEQASRKIFGSPDAIGEVLTLENEGDFHVTGIIENIPGNSHIQFELLIPYVEGRRIGVAASQVLMFMTYVRVEHGASLQTVDEKIRDIFEHIAPESPAKVAVSLQPLTRVHMHSDFDRDIEGHGDMTVVTTFSFIAWMVLLIACINFMNLSTARSGKRAKEVGVRKALGAGRGDLIRQFYGESLLLCGFALLLSLVVVEITLPLFNDLSGKQLSLTHFGNWIVLCGVLGIVVVTALISGSYPALVLSALPVLKGKTASGRGPSSFRRILVVFQFTLSITLIIASVVVSRQIDYLRNRKLGYDKENVVYVPLTEESRAKLPVLRNTLLPSDAVVAVSAVSELPTSIERATDYTDWDGKTADENVLMRVFGVDPWTPDVLQLEMAEGRFFSLDFPTDPEEGYVINQSAATLMRMDPAVGRRFNMWRREGRIIGVVKDFNFRSLHQEIEPLILSMMPGWSNYLCIRLSAGDLQASLQHIESTWNTLVPHQLFEFHFLDETYENLYRSEERTGTLLGCFTVLALIISCLGLTGLASFMAERRTKEIGIRKTVGASVSGLVFLLSKEFLKLVGLSTIMAWPVGYFVMDYWLSGFAYQTKLSYGVFVSAGLTALVIAFVTISYQTTRAATANPVEALRYE